MKGGRKERSKDGWREARKEYRKEGEQEERKQEPMICVRSWRVLATELTERQLMIDEKE